MTANETRRIALVTGAVRGIGLETARQLARQGIHVLVAGRRQEQADGVADRLRGEGLSAEGVVLDIDNPAQLTALRDYIATTYGRLDILVNNAGVLLDRGADGAAPPPSATPDKTLRDTFEINLFATVQVTQTLLPLVLKSPAGRIVNLSSILASLGAHSDPASPIYGKLTFAYDASKTALNAFTVHLAHELKDTAVKVNSAHPGWVRTDMGGQDAPLDVAQGALTSVRLATLPDDGPTGGFFHMDHALPW
ncbi:SDR family oxidoreductase [Gluconacetobacter diazotrophicus]|uniref:SDR family oxidoreductase n=2 Tax=Gluconacetobacter diazotrophicus TaxID=33996 RepID=A0A7W4FBR4_GLUDI|nr:SDR family oxidoreductase [Gluconacetobacter diazotrophicus]MBB2154762.1 SDR family oxidoreductase [Gluconacetobacter diazotrophicus]